MEKDPIPKLELVGNLYDWVDDCEIEVTRDKRGRDWIELLVNPKLTVEDLQGLRLKAGSKMPFQVVLETTGFKEGTFKDKGKIKERLAEADWSIFAHGHASIPDVWDEDFVRSMISRRDGQGKPVVAVLPYGLGVKGICQTSKIDGKDCFTGEDYGQQLAYFIKRFLS